MLATCSRALLIQLDVPMRYTLSTEISEREIYVIGSIVAQWGFIESEIFDQTRFSFEEDEDLPASMKTNAQFKEVLELWLERVAAVHQSPKKTILTEQYQRIKSLSEFRQAVVHSRWEWKPDAPGEITAVRVHKQNIKRVKFTFDHLKEFAISLGEIRYSIRYPGGLQDRAEEIAGMDGHLSRLGWDLLSGRVSLDDLTKRGEKE